MTGKHIEVEWRFVLENTNALVCKWNFTMYNLAIWHAGSIIDVALPTMVVSLLCEFSNLIVIEAVAPGFRISHGTLCKVALLCDWYLWNCLWMCTKKYHIYCKQMYAERGCASFCAKVLLPWFSKDLPWRCKMLHQNKFCREEPVHKFSRICF